MNRVALVRTVHDEVGQANVLELHAILERIQPEVVFLEVPPMRSYWERNRHLYAKEFRKVVDNRRAEATSPG